MHKARTILRMEGHIFRSWVTTPRVYVALVMNAFVVSVISARLLAFSRFVAEPVNILEPFIISGSEASWAVFLPLGFLLLLADAPFVTSRTPYELIRVGRAQWVKAQLVYIVMAGVVFYGLTALISGLLVAPNAFVGNLWSRPLYYLSRGDRTAIELFQIAFEYPQFIGGMRPLTAWFQVLSLSMLYGIVLGMILFVFNLRGHALGWILATLVHVIGYAGIRSAFLFVIPPKLWLFAYSVPTWLDGEGAFGVEAFESYILFLGLIVLLSMLAMRQAKHVALERRAT